MKKNFNCFYVFIKHSDSGVNKQRKTFSVYWSMVLNYILRGNWKMNLKFNIKGVFTQNASVDVTNNLEALIRIKF